VLDVKGSLRRARLRRALDLSAPFRPDADRDGRLRREHSTTLIQSKRPASLLRRKASLKTNPSNHEGLDRSLHIRIVISSMVQYGTRDTYASAPFRRILLPKASVRDASRQRPVVPGMSDAFAGLEKRVVELGRHCLAAPPAEKFAGPGGRVVLWRKDEE
jgi:hypothetical protein